MTLQTISYSLRVRILNFHTLLLVIKHFTSLIKHNRFNTEKRTNENFPRTFENNIFLVWYDFTFKFE